MGGINEKWTDRPEIVNDADFASSAIDVINLLDNPTSHVPQPKALPEPRFMAATEVHGNNIFMVGGASLVLAGNKLLVHNTMWKFDPEQNTWETKSPMKNPRALLCTVTIGDNIFAIGGWSHLLGNMRWVERYDIKSDTWTSDTSLPYRLDLAAACAVGGKGYVVGGRSVDSDHYSRDILILDFDTSGAIIWTKLPDILPKGIRQHNVVTDGNLIFIIGGLCNKVRLDDLITFNPTSRKIDQLKAMPQGIVSTASLIYEDSLYVISQAKSVNNAILKYNITQENEWEELSLKVKASLQWHAAALITFG